MGGCLSKFQGSAADKTKTQQTSVSGAAVPPSEDVKSREAPAAVPSLSAGDAPLPTAAHGPETDPADIADKAGTAAAAMISATAADPDGIKMPKVSPDLLPVCVAAELASGSGAGSCVAGQGALLAKAVSLRFFLEFSKKVPEGMPTSEVVRQIIAPATLQGGCCYADTLPVADVGAADYYVVHRWAAPFSQLVELVRSHLGERRGPYAAGPDTASAAFAPALPEPEQQVAAAQPPGIAPEAAAAEPPALVAEDSAQAGAADGAEPLGVPVPAAGAAAEPADGSPEVQQQQQGLQLLPLGEPGCAAEGEVYLWLDVFALQQQQQQQRAGDGPPLPDAPPPVGPELCEAVRGAGRVLLCLDDRGEVLSRAWCLWEVWQAHLAGGAKLHVLSSSSLDSAAVKQAYCDLDVQEAKASLEQDRAAILADIAASGVSCDALNAQIREALLQATGAEADTVEHSILPAAKSREDYQAVIQAAQRHALLLEAAGRSEDAARYCHLVTEAGQALVSMLPEPAPEPPVQPPTPDASFTAAVPPVAVAAAADAAPAAEAAASPEAPPPGPEVVHPVLAKQAEECADWGAWPQADGLRRHLRQAKERQAKGKPEEALKMHREALQKASEIGLPRAPSGRGARGAAPPPPPPQAPPAAADTAACRLHLALCLKSRGQVEAALQEGSAGVASLEELLPADSLPLASARFQLAQLAKGDAEGRGRALALLGQALRVQEAKLGRSNEVTLETIGAMGQLLAASGEPQNLVAGIELCREYASALSGGHDVSCEAFPHGLHLGDKAADAWQQLAAAMQARAGTEDEVAAIARALLPHRRLQHLQQLHTVLPALRGAAANSARKRLAQLLPPAAASAGTGAPAAAAPPSYDKMSREAFYVHVSSLPGMWDPKDKRYDNPGAVEELHMWAVALAKKGRMEDAIRLEWRIADVARANDAMACVDVQLPRGVVKVPEAYQQGLMLEMSVPGAAKVAADMLLTKDAQVRRLSNAGILPLDPAAEAAAAAAAAEALALAAIDAGGSAAAPPVPVAPLQMPPPAAAGAPVGAAPAAADGPAEATTSGGSDAAGAVATAGGTQWMYGGPSCGELNQMMDEARGREDYEAAAERLREALACQVAAWGPDSSEAVAARVEFAQALHACGKKDEAVAEMRAAAAAHERVSGGKDVTAALSMQKLAAMLPRGEEAEHLHRRALELVQKLHDPEHALVGQVLAGYGSWRREAEEEASRQQGQAMYAQGVAILNKAKEKQMAKEMACF